MRDEGVPFVFAEQVLEVVEKGEAFFVGDAGEGVVRVLAFEVHD